MNDAHPTPTDAMIEAGSVAASSVAYPANDAVIRLILQAALAQQQPSGEIVGYLYEAATGLGEPASEGLRQEKFSKANPAQYFGATNIRPLYAHPPAMEDAWNANMDEAPFTRPVLVRRAGVSFSAIRKMPRAAKELGGEWIAWANGLLCRNSDCSLMIVEPEAWQHLPQPPKEQG